MTHIEHLQRSIADIIKKTTDEELLDLIYKLLLSEC